MMKNLIGKILFIIGLVYSSTLMLIIALGSVFNQEIRIFENDDTMILWVLSFIVMLVGIYFWVMAEKKDAIKH